MTVVVEVYRGKVWVVAVDSSFTSEAILEPVQVKQLVDLLTHAAREARSHTEDPTP